MKKIIYIVIAAVAFVATSCQMDMGFDRPVSKDQGLILKFSCDEMLTKAPIEGLDNEDMVKQIEYFLFPLNSEGKVEDATEYVYHNTITPDNGLAGSYEEVIQPGVLSELFPDGATEAVVFAVANYCDSDNAGTFSIASIPETVTTWKDLHDLEVGATFFKAGGSGFGKRWPRVLQPDDESLFFVMVADSVGVQLHTTGSYAVDAEVPLNRLGSKVTVNFEYETVVETKESGNITWVPQPSGKETRVYLSNAICNTTLGGPLTRSLNPDGGGEDSPWSDRDLFEYAYDFMKDVPEIDGKKTAHYYTYPIQMEAGDDNQPFIKLVLPWYGYKWIGEGTAPATVDTTNAGWRLYKQMEVYYKIALPRESITEPNRIYEYSVTVNIIGSEKEVGIQSYDYLIKDWLSDEAISSNVATGRYISLDIPKDEYNMYTDFVQIAFVSSGEVEISDLQIDQEDFYNQRVNHLITGKNQNGYTYGTGYNANTEDIEGNKLPEWATIQGRHLVIRHVMNNNFNAASFDVAPMTFKVKLHLKDAETTFDRTVTITQYPALFVTKNEHVGYVIINRRTNPGNNQAVDDNGGNLGSIQDQTNLGTGANTNPNNYNVYVSDLAGHTKGWVIGDPRDNPGTISGLAVTKYRKTRSDASNVISPSFKIASSYGKVMQNVPNFTQATARCAAYQENGYPAGRWRVPTEAEIEFCVELSNKEMIPSLFNYSYWASSGRYYDYQTGWHNESGTHAVRCVYDIWFWGEEKSDECKDDSGDTYNTWGGYQD